MESVILKERRKMNEMTVVVFLDEEIEIYKIDREFFEGLIEELDPWTQDDWEEVHTVLMDKGQLIKKIRPDYTITLLS